MSAVQSTSPLVLSSYDIRGQYLCYVTTALDKQRISVESTQTGQTEASLNKIYLYLDSSNLRVTALKWAFLNSNETLCVFIGLNNGEIWLYSPLANEVVLKLSTENSYAINDLVVAGESLFSVDSNDVIYEFDLVKFSLRNHFKVESCVNLKRIQYVSENRILVASHQIFLINITKKEVILTLPGHISPVSILEMLSSEYIISGAENDRFLNIYDLTSGVIKSVLVAKSNINKISMSGQNVIAVTTEKGDVEVFIDPLIINKTKRRNVKSRQCTKTVSLVNTDDKLISSVNIFVTNDILNLTYLTNATIPCFTQLRWADISLDHKIKLDLSFNLKNQSADRSLHGNDLASTATYREGNARITSGDNFKHIEDVIKEWEAEISEDRSNEDEEDNKIESLADKIPIAHTTKKKNPVTGTVAVVLSQALQSNDHSLLETVLNNRDERIIRDTIMRLKPTLSVILLERLAERISRQTHRQGTLNVWVKWCIIIHGGYLIAVPNLMKTLASLHSTLKNRAGLLDRLLALETRLDSVLNKLDTPQTDDSNSPEYMEDVLDDEDDVEYVEELDDANLIESGEEGESSEDEDEQDSNDEDKAPYANEQDTNDTADVGEDEEGYSDVEMV